LKIPVWNSYRKTKVTANIKRSEGTNWSKKECGSGRRYAVEKLKF